MQRDERRSSPVPASEPLLLTGAGSGSKVSDAVLLARFVEQWDHGAFRDLVSRHGPMVLGVCRRILHDPNAADDAFQATFLLLVRKADSVRKRQSVGPWLFGVARRVALEARDVAGRRPVAMNPASEATAPDNHEEFERDELYTALHEELGRLPEKYRAPLVLCYLEGLTHQAVADHLGWPIGSVRGRIARGRDLLGARLVRRGWKLAAVLLALNLLPKRAGAVPARLLEATMRPAVEVAAGEAAPRGLFSARVAELERKVRKSMHLARLKWIAVVAVTTVLIGATLAAMLPGALAADDETVQIQSETKKLQGTWAVISCEESGKREQNTTEYRLKFDGDTIALMEGEQVNAKGPFKLDPSRDPMEMDIAFQEGKMKGKTGHVIYAWDGANLKFCGAIDPKPRPTEFQTTAGDERLLMLLKRP